jgi:hypothetical protein
MTNKYLVKVCALLRPPANKKTTSNAKSPYKVNPVSKAKPNKYSIKIKRQKQRVHQGETVHRQHKVK